MTDTILIKTISLLLPCILRRHTRRLLLGSHPSAKAVALAKKYYMKLEDGYTFVTQFERKQSIKVHSKSTAYEKVISQI